jgi:Fe-S cluster biogenesis protein NfuA
MPIDTELEPAELEGRVLEAIELIRPALQSDGGDIVFDNLDDDGVVHVSLVGACGTCPISMQTLKAGVERIIMDRAPGVTAVVDASLDDEDPIAGSEKRCRDRSRRVGRRRPGR